MKKVNERFAWSHPCPQAQRDQVNPGLQFKCPLGWAVAKRAGKESQELHFHVNIPLTYWVLICNFQKHSHLLEKTICGSISLFIAPLSCSGFPLGSPQNSMSLWGFLGPKIARSRLFSWDSDSTGWRSWGARPVLGLESFISFYHPALSCWTQSAWTHWRSRANFPGWGESGSLG